MQNYVSFDFDGVLHVSMNPNSIHPKIWSWVDGEDERPQPRMEYHKILKKEAQTNPIIITTSRCEESRIDIQDFIDFYQLPVREIYLTCMEPKIRLFKELTRQGIKVIRHYDDDPNISRQIIQFGFQIQFIQVPMVTAKMAKGENPYGECFKEFLSHEQPSKAKGFIDRKGNIHYHENPMGWIQFRRTNLEGSLKNSFWNVRIPVLNSRVKEALRIWALNMPEHYEDNVIIQNKGKTTVERIANFDFKFEPVATSVTVVQLSVIPF